MQKALELTNIKLITVISNIDGKTLLCFMDASLVGEYNPELLADMSDRWIKASCEEIIKSFLAYRTKSIYLNYANASRYSSNTPLND